MMKNIDQLEAMDFFSGNDVAPCQRCGVPCRVASSTNPDARLLKHAPTPEGFCPNCAVTEFLLGFEFMIGSDVRRLLSPHIQQQFAEIMRAGNADAMPDEIDWNAIVANWELPFPKAKRKRGKR